MTKRDTPDSGFDATKSPKRQFSKPAPTSHPGVPAQSLLSETFAPRNPDPIPHSTSNTFANSSLQAGPSNGAGAHNGTPSKPSHERTDDLFLPEPQPDDSVKEHGEFVPSDEQRNELVVELAQLRAKPSTTIDEAPSPSDHADRQDDEGQQEHCEDEQPASQFPGKRKKKNKKKLKEKQARKSYIDPLFWPEGLPDREAQYIARRSDSLVCGTTNISLDTEALVVNGTVWKEILADELPELLRNSDGNPLLPEQDRFDFLKACLRLGSFVEPHQLSRLLGGGYRSPEYCSFLLQGFLGLLHNSKVRRVLGENSPEQLSAGHTDVVVHADQLYPSDDELILDYEANMTNSHEEGVLDSADVEVALIEESDREEDEGHGDPIHTHHSVAHGFRPKKHAETRFLATPSYVLRNYMSIVSGRKIKEIGEFESYVAEVGGTFRGDPRQEPLKRLKWLREKMPAPNLRRNVVPQLPAVSEPLQLWKYAMKRYSRRNLARCALIKTNSLLDWLGFVANETTTVTSEKEFFEEKRPVVAVAPVPTLYLADKVVDFILRVLAVAVQTEELSSVAAEDETDHILIDKDDVASAAHEVVDHPDMKRVLMMSEFVRVLGNEHTYNGEWPSLLQRPMTGYETVELCARTPKAFISVPTTIMEEMRAVVMSFREFVKHRIYAKSDLMKARDPFMFMSGPERAASKNRRKQLNHAYGINRYATAEVQSDGEHWNEYDEGASGPENELQETSPTKTIIGQEEDTKITQPAGDKQNPENLRTSSSTLPIKLREKLPDFFDQVNFAELVAFRLGKEEIKRLKGATNKAEFEESTESSDDAAMFLKEIGDGKTCTTSTVCYHRLGWVCLHALGISPDKHQGQAQLVGYGSLANYTNFAQFRGKKPVVLTKTALSFLAQMADAIVRSEGEILMSCAAHDDGRPWLDRADVALVTSVRKEPFHYSDL